MKSLIVLLTLLKSGKLLTTGGTMIVSLGAYALAYGWRFAAGFIALLFAHEMGHFIAARQRGLNVGAPTFIPFVGAWIEMKDMPHDAETEAYVGFGGPFVGTLAALFCYFLARVVDSPVLLAIAYVGFFLNLFNLIPISPSMADGSLPCLRRASGWPVYPCCSLGSTGDRVPCSSSLLSWPCRRC